MRWVSLKKSLQVIAVLAACAALSPVDARSELLGQDGTDLSVPSRHLLATDSDPSCGALDQVCCPGELCDTSDIACRLSRCRACGVRLGPPCVAGGTFPCNEGLTPRSGVCFTDTAGAGRGPVNPGCSPSGGQCSDATECCAIDGRASTCPSGTCIASMDPPDTGAAEPCSDTVNALLLAEPTIVPRVALAAAFAVYIANVESDRSAVVADIQAAYTDPACVNCPPTPTEAEAGDIFEGWVSELRRRQAEIATCLVSGDGQSAAERNDELTMTPAARMLLSHDGDAASRLLLQAGINRLTCFIACPECRLSVPWCNQVFREEYCFLAFNTGSAAMGAAIGTLVGAGPGGAAVGTIIGSVAGRYLERFCVSRAEAECAENEPICSACEDISPECQDPDACCCPDETGTSCGSGCCCCPLNQAPRGSACQCVAA